MPTIPAAGPTWAAVQDRLATELATLADREFVVLGEPAPPAPPRGLLRRRAQPAPSRYVQFLRMGDVVSGECVGARSFGGDWDVTPEQDRRLRELGWLAPGGVPGEDMPYPNYRRDEPLAGSGRLAAAGVAALEVLGLRPDGRLELRREP